MIRCFWFLSHLFFIFHPEYSSSSLLCYFYSCSHLLSLAPFCSLLLPVRFIHCYVYVSLLILSHFPSFTNWARAWVWVLFYFQKEISIFNGPNKHWDKEIDFKYFFPICSRFFKGRHFKHIENTMRELCQARKQSSAQWKAMEGNRRQVKASEVQKLAWFSKA